MLSPGRKCKSSCCEVAMNYIFWNLVQTCSPVCFSSEPTAAFSIMNLNPLNVADYLSLLCIIFFLFVAALLPCCQSMQDVSFRFKMHSFSPLQHVENITTRAFACLGWRLEWCACWKLFQITKKSTEYVRIFAAAFYSWMCRVIPNSLFSIQSLQPPRSFAFSLSKQAKFSHVLSRWSSTQSNLLCCSVLLQQSCDSRIQQELL